MNLTKTASGELYLRAYRAICLLGEGGIGQVLLGRHMQTGQEVVIKVMREHLADEPRLRTAFEREMQVMLRFRHPYAVSLLDGAFGDKPCLVLEFVRGITLTELVRREGRLEPQRVGRLLGQLCQVLHAAHGMGILHRDLSLDNLMVVPATPGGMPEHIKVMDFGLARLGAGFFVPLEKLTGSGNSIGGGTPDFMCPEQIRGEGVDHRGDLYSVGVIAFKMLTGSLPFGETDDPDVADILLAHVKNEPLKFADLGVHDVPPALETAVRLCLAKYPHERPQSARELAIRLSQALGQQIAKAEDFPVTETLRLHVRPEDGVELDRVEAWMPEQIAVMKLRGFVEGVGGKIESSEPGLISVRLIDPRVKPFEKPRGFLAMFGLGRKTLTEPSTLLIELHMEKKKAGTCSLVEIIVVLPKDPQVTGEIDQAMRVGFAERICRELRSYLMIGR